MLVARYEQARLQTIRSLEGYLQSDSLWTAFQKLLNIPLRYLQTCTFTTSTTSASVPIMIPPAEKSSLKILSNCYALMKESLELTELEGVIDNEMELLRQYEAYRRNHLILDSTEGRMEFIAIQNNLALCHYEQGRLGSSETILRHCIHQYHQFILHFTPLFPSPLSLCGSHFKREYLYLLFNLANVLNRLQRFEESESLYLFCLEQIEKSYSPSPPSSPASSEIESKRYDDVSHDHDYLSILSNLASLYARNQLPCPYAYSTLAEKLFRECLVRRKEMLEMIRSDKVAYQQKLASGYYRHYGSHHYHPILLSRERARRVDDDILRREEYYSLDARSLGHENDEEVGMLEQYELLTRHYSIPWLHSLFNLCCHLIETGHYDDPRFIFSSLQECLEKSKELNLEDGDEFIDRISILMKRLDQQQREQKPKEQWGELESLQFFFRSLWANIYSQSEENILHSNHSSVPTSNRSFLSRWCEMISIQRIIGSGHGGGGKDWGDVVMNPNEWFDSSFQINASSAMPRHLASYPRPISDTESRPT